MNDSGRSLIESSRPGQRPPSTVALATAACFAGKNVAIVLGGIGLGLGTLIVTHKILLTLLVWAATMIPFLLGVRSTMTDPRFIARIAADDLPLPTAPSGKVLSAMGGVGLTGAFRDGFDRIKKLKDGLAGDIKALPAGPGKEAFIEYVPRLEELVQEVHEICTKGQRLQKDRDSGGTQSLAAEVASLEKRLESTTDPTARTDLEQAVERKKQALGHLAGVTGRAEQIEARLEAIVAALQEARARVGALTTQIDDASGVESARRTVDDLSIDVKYLAESVEETTRLMNRS